MDGIVGWLLEFLLDAFTTVLQFIQAGLLRTPDVTALPQVIALNSRSVVVVDTVFVLVFTAAAAITVTAGGNERARYEVKDLLPRAVVGFIAAHFSPLVISQAITVTNAFIGAFSVDDLDRSGALPAIRRIVDVAGSDPASPLLVALLVGVVAVLLATTAFGLLTRIAILLVLAAIAPVALALHALPQTDPLARTWWRALGGCLITPLLQAFCLQAGAWLLMAPEAMLPMFNGLAGAAMALANLLVVIMVLYLTVKVPGLVKKYVMSSASQNTVLGVVLRSAAVKQAARAVGVPVPGVGR
ncbi:hypothetical protein GCM10009828_022600 [Actinoplanes couchii]|uniref:TrbL/VirB6 plasmid conjugal transfer protein n=2 Tax=Actinoplanes couchii TaxID=403638 RepID=A0ABQ3XST2_9ACTN|nr:hypothetical protein Aco03nite_099730 [Actinoplanes couchii]